MSIYDYIKGTNFSNGYIIECKFKDLQTMTDIEAIAKGLGIECDQFKQQLYKYNGTIIRRSRAFFRTIGELNKFLENVLEPLWVMNVLNHGENFYYENLWPSLNNGLLQQLSLKLVKKEITLIPRELIQPWSIEENPKFNVVQNRPNYDWFNVELQKKQ
jgi:hypothetical protein